MLRRLLIFFYIIGISGELLSSPTPRFENGVLDIRSWNFSKPLKLEGDIQFYWNQLIDPNKAELNSEGSLIKIGTAWNVANENSDLRLQPHGYGTYRFKILTNKSEIYSLYIPTISTAYNFYINGDYILSVGKVGVSRSESIGFLHPQVIQLPQEEELEILIQVSNYDHIKAGLWRFIKIGKHTQINSFHDNAVALDFFIFGSFLIMSLYHFGLYILHRKDKSTLYFGLFLFILSFRSLVTGEHYLYQLLGVDNFSIDWGLRIEFFAFYLGIPTLLGYLYSIFPKQTNKIIFVSLFGLLLTLCLIVILFPANIFTKFTPHVEYLIIFTGIFGMYVLVKALVDKAEGSSIALFGFFVFFVFVLNDISYTRNFIDTGYYAHVGFFLFVLIQSFFISRRFAKAFDRVEDLSNNLEKLVEIRTNEYKIEKKKADEAGVWKDNLISLVAHDLRSPLASFYGAIELLEDEEMSRDEKKQIFKSSRAMIRHSLSTISHLLNLNRFQTGYFTLTKEKINLLELINSVVESMRSETEAKSQNVEIQIDKKYQANLDRFLIGEVIRNILLNAVKFSPESSTIVVQLSQINGNYALSIIDQGMGMTEETKKNLIAGNKQQSKYGTAGEKGFGIGMSICIQLIQAHGGSLHVESMLGEGTNVSIIGLEII
ncbi:sensor histidine kinase [Leptospira sp. GIMC2001]|uniref:sensor histidine kinase n=1 Tax=Leptospira sp. GIMC2001 TaxID=1513297 RepID=UPI00234A23E8|nr:sensor histidine kinase [Leptospira sp. GIMC2001]WCL48787.1 sensor histidine kinase [Leptospira sp. GIMC2001]